MKNKHQYYVAEKGFDNLFNAGVVRKDNEAILDSIGFKAFHFSTTGKKSPGAGISRFFKLLQFVLHINKSSLVVFHFPVNASIYKVLLAVLNWRGITTVAIVIDIDGLRDNDIALLNKEIKLLSRFTYIVAHNAAMKTWLLQYLPTATIYTIDLFDYPINGTVPHREYSTKISFAGNIAKAKFVYSIQKTQGLHFNVYGTEYNAAFNVTNGFSYKGVFKPAQLPAELEGSFGLVWDGDSFDTGAVYLKYNTPHKLSLYLAAGLPVIVWEKSAVAAMVKEKNIGIIINQLIETEEKVKAMTVDEYNRMQQNVLLIGKQLRRGFYLKNVFDLINKDTLSH